MDKSQNAVQHTPGPWHIDVCTGYIDIEAERGDAVAAIDIGASDQSHANARLIAAAPDLLLAAQEAMRLIEWLHLLGRGDAEIFRHDLRGEAERFEARIAPAIAKVGGDHFA